MIWSKLLIHAINIQTLLRAHYNLYNFSVSTRHEYSNDRRSSPSYRLLQGISFAKSPLPIEKFTVNNSINYHKRHLVYEKIFKPRPQYFVRGGYVGKYAISVGRRNNELSSHNNNNNGNEPFWLAPTKGFIRGVKSVFSFLAEQPSQLKYIEWPGFQNTVKTAVLTLVLVAMLIVVLSTVDSGLWYVLTSILRKPA